MATILAIDAGNSNIVLGCMQGETLRFTARVRTDRAKTEDEYALVLRNLFELHQVERHGVEGAILSCVVSELTDVLCRAVEMVVKKRPLVVGAGLKTGLNIKIDDPAQLGAALVAGAVAALEKFPAPLIIFDLGTADTMSVLDGQGRFLGGAIMAGPRLCADALSSRTSQLPRIELEAPPRVVGSNTVQCMQSGAIYGHAAMIDGLIDRVAGELGAPPVSVVATGAMAHLVISFCRHPIALEENLMLQGLKSIYEKNQKKSR
ncbi:MAG: type III pantothenate kinase [Oscillospiraceae bacterium]|nr:type III pantothenate kinase [Oscillospiraceae bacterium]